jgi:signal transduction histidine kinase
MEDGKMELTREAISLPDLITEVLERFAPTVAERQISLSFSENGNLPPVLIDKSIIKRVIANLLDNAIRYTPTGGAIEVGVKSISDKGALCFTVKDSGTGIPAEYHEKIFDKFEQVKLKKEGDRAGSSGLGLTFCKMAVEAHGGKIWVESEGMGKGAVFQALLPLSAQ